MYFRRPLRILRPQQLPMWNRCALSAGRDLRRECPGRRAELRLRCESTIVIRRSLSFADSVRCASRLALVVVCGGCALSVGPTLATHEDASVRADSASRCPLGPDDPGSYPSLCDQAGRVRCLQWAERGAAFLSTHFRCLEAAQTCAFADQCTGDTVDTCRCGDGPACGPGQICVSQAENVRPYCVCRSVPGS